MLLGTRHYGPQPLPQVWRKRCKPNKPSSLILSNESIQEICIVMSCTWASEVATGAPDSRWSRWPDARADVRFASRQTSTRTQSPPHWMGSMRLTHSSLFRPSPSQPLNLSPMRPAQWIGSVRAESNNRLITSLQSQQMPKPHANSVFVMSTSLSSGIGLEDDIRFGPLLACLSH